MAVEDTLSLLNSLTKLSEKQQGEDLVEAHRELICKPLKKFFPQATTEEIQGELLTRGLFDSYESGTVAEILGELERKCVWQTVQDEFDYLKRAWGGPDVSIFIYPLTNHRPTVDGIEINKNGVSYSNVLFLFVAAELKNEELKALLAHEYHHICRLSFLDKPPHEIELLDTLIMEGLAEFAVEKLYGEQFLSPWTKRYSQLECLTLWTKFYLRVLRLKGVDNHFPFLYGNLTEGLPNWSGYCIGYRIVRTYIENGGEFNQQLLYKTPSDEILKISNFKI